MKQRVMKQRAMKQRTLQQQGFTLVELIAVLVILGILTATALPRFIDLSGSANQAATDAIAGNITSASALNYAADVTENAGITGGDQPVTTTGLTCSTAAAALLVGGLPDGYTLDTTSIATDGTSYTCTVSRVAGSTTYTADATIIGATDD